MDAAAWTTPPPSDAEKIADEELALRLLAGFKPEGIEHNDYPVPGSKDEKQCRVALARIVRAHIRGLVGDLLALALDPETLAPIDVLARTVNPDARPTMTPTRTILFDRRPRSTWARDRAVVHFIAAGWLHARPPPQLKAVMYAASRHFDISVKRVEQIWNDDCKQVGRPRKRK